MYPNTMGGPPTPVAGAAALPDQNPWAPPVEAEEPGGEATAVTEPAEPFWQSMLTMLAWVGLIAVGLNWLIRHGREVQDFLERVRSEVGAIREALGSGIVPLVDQVSSPTAGYTLFVIVVVIYGGIALVALWVLFEDGALGHGSGAAEDPHLRQVRRMVGGDSMIAVDAPRRTVVVCAIDRQLSGVVGSAAGAKRRRPSGETPPRTRQQVTPY